MSEATIRNSDVGITDEMLRLNGMQICEGCEEMIIGHKICAECLRIADAFEAKRLEEKRFLESHERRNVGLVPYEPGEPYGAREAFAELPRRIQLALLACACGGASVTGLVVWYLFKAGVWFALAVSR